MNPKKILILITVLIFAVLMNAQFASFRSMSTAGILEGDIEHILIPGEMAYVEGFNVYTNLSNFHNSSEDVFTGAVQYNYLAGTKFDMSGLHTGILHRSNNSSFSEEEMIISNYLEDRTGNTEYDFHAKDSTEYYDNVASHEDVTYYGFAYGAKDEMRFGFAYTRNNWSNHMIDNEMTVSMSEDLITDDILSESYMIDNYSSVFANVDQTFELSMYYPMDMMDIGFNIHFGPGLYKMHYIYDDTLHMNRAPGTADINYYDSTATDTMDYQLNETNWGLGTVVSRNCENYMGEFNVYYSNTSMGRTEYLDFMQTYNVYETTPTIIGNDTLQISETETNQDGDSLSFMQSGNSTLSTNVKYVRKLDKALFGFGAGFSMTSRDTTYVYYYNREYSEIYNDGDGIADAGDYEYTESGTYTEQQDWNSMYHSLRFPVGVEFNANDHLVFRLGAATTFQWRNSFQASRITDWEPTTFVYEDATGFIAEGIIDDPAIRTEGDLEEHEFTKQTNYSYGLGWNISDNFSVDLMGFSDLTDMTGWKISANAKF